MLSVLLVVLSGAFSWTFAEYCLHRWVGHSRAGGLQFTMDHRSHHRDGNVFAPLSRKLLTAFTVTGMLFLILLWPAGSVVSACFSVGFVMGFLGYEWLHWSLHAHGPSTAYGRWARRHHFFHHFHNPKRNHGVSSPLWDLVFGTYSRVSQVIVPSQQVVRWLPVSGSGIGTQVPGFALVGQAPKEAASTL